MINSATNKHPQKTTLKSSALKASSSSDCLFSESIRAIKQLQHSISPQVETHQAQMSKSIASRAISGQRLKLGKVDHTISQRIHTERSMADLRPQRKKKTNAEPKALTERVRQLKKYESVKEIATKHMVTVIEEEEEIKDMIQQVSGIRATKKSLTQHYYLQKMQQAQEQQQKKKFFRENEAQRARQRQKQLQSLLNQVLSTKIQMEIQIQTLRRRQNQLVLENEANYTKVLLLESEETHLNELVSRLKEDLQKFNQRPEKLILSPEVVSLCLSSHLTQILKDNLNKHSLSIAEAKLEHTSKLLLLQKKEKQRLAEELETLESIRQIEKKNLQLESDLRLELKKKISRQCDSLKSQNSRLKAENKRVKERIDKIGDQNRTLKQRLQWIEKKVSKETLTMTLTLEQYYSRVVFDENQQEEQGSFLSESRSSKIMSETDNISSINLDLDDSDAEIRLRLGDYITKNEEMEKSLRVRTQKLQDLEVKNMRLQNSLKELESQLKQSSEKGLDELELTMKVESLEKELDIKQSTIERLRKITNLNKNEANKSMESKRLMRFGTQASASDDEVPALQQSKQSQRSEIVTIPRLCLNFDNEELQ